MRIKNTSRYDADELRLLLEFASKGIAGSRVEVHVKGTPGRLRGLAYRGIPTIAHAAIDSRYLVTLHLPHDRQKMPSCTGTRLKRILALWPQGIPIQTWQDAVVFLAAHEFRHVWQFQRARRTGRRGKGEYDAEKFALLRLNQWRAGTGRQLVPPVRQPNPFCPKTETAAVTNAARVFGLPPPRDKSVRAASLQEQPAEPAFGNDSKPPQPAPPCQGASS